LSSGGGGFLSSIGFALWPLLTVCAYPAVALEWPEKIKMFPAKPSIIITQIILFITHPLIHNQIDVSVTEQNALLKPSYSDVGA
jgi:hypothetical protein